MAPAEAVLARDHSVAAWQAVRVADLLRATLFPQIGVVLNGQVWNPLESVDHYTFTDECPGLDYDECDYLRA